MKSITSVSALVHFEGFHSWPDPSPHRAYLASLHRHLFHVKVSVQVGHDDRDIECHDLRDFILLALEDLVDDNVGRPLPTFGHRSCESIAREVGQAVAKRWPNRILEVEVLEDGEVGATVGLVP